MSLHLALFLETTGCHYSGWRMPGAAQANPADWATIKSLAQKAEAAKFDLILWRINCLLMISTVKAWSRRCAIGSRRGPNPFRCCRRLAR